jgi:predicted RNA-binding protein with PIN domain
VPPKSEEEVRKPLRMPNEKEMVFFDAIYHEGLKGRYQNHEKELKVYPSQQEEQFFDAMYQEGVKKQKNLLPIEHALRVKYLKANQDMEARVALLASDHYVPPKLITKDIDDLSFGREKVLRHRNYAAHDKLKRGK